MSKFKITLLILFSTAFTLAIGQDLHPRKQIYADWQSWPEIKASEIEVSNFKPYRAVYQREYINGKGERRTDEVINICQKVAWYGKEIILFEVHDVGNVESSDTNARSQFFYLDKNTLSIILAIGPQSGTPTDYTTIRVMEDKIVMSTLKTESGKSDSSILETSEPILPFSHFSYLLYGALDLEVNQKIRISGVIIPSRNSIEGVLGWVSQKEKYKMPNGKKVEAFIVEEPGNPTSPYVSQHFIIDRPPYLLADRIMNFDTNEIQRWYIKLKSFEYLDN